MRRDITYPTVTQPGDLEIETGITATRTEYYYGYGEDFPGKLKSLEDEEGVETTYDYDAGTGLLAEKVILDAVEVGEETKDLRVSYEYDVLGRILRERTYEYDSATTPVRVKRWVYTLLNCGDAEDGYVIRRVTLQYDHVIENGATVTAREGTIHITVSTLDGQKLEEAEGYVDDREGEETFDDDLTDDFDDSEETMEDAFQGQLYDRTSYVYSGSALIKVQRWEDAESGTTTYDTEYKHDSMGRVIEEIDAEGTKTKYVRDALGRIETIKVGLADDNDGILTVIEDREYDDGGWDEDRVTEIVQKVNGAAADDRVTRFGYDSWNRLLWTANRTTSNDANAWVVTERKIGTDSGYDNLDRVTGETVHWATKSGTWGGSITWTPYGENPSTGNPQRFWQVVTQTGYDERGRVYQTVTQRIPVKASGPDTNSAGAEHVVTTWYDKRSLVVKHRQPEMRFVTGNDDSYGAFRKLAYDGARRVISEYSGFDSDEYDDDHTNAKAVGGDTVLLERHYQYDELGNRIFARTYERKSGVATTGALEDSISNAEWRFVGVWYDPIGRTETVIDYGDNGRGDNHLAARPANKSERNDPYTLLRTDYDYGYYPDQEDDLYSGQPTNSSWIETLDPYDKPHYVFFDNLGRTIRTIRNYDDGSPSATSGGVLKHDDVTTESVFDKLDRVVKNIGHEYVTDLTTPKQVTNYVYGVTKDDDTPVDSELRSKRLLRRIRYGQDNGGGSYEKEVVFAYNRQGQAIYRGARADSTTTYRTSREFVYTYLGQLTVDSVDVEHTDSGVDTWILSIVYEYDSEGRSYRIKSYGSEAERNRVTYTYDAEGRVQESHQYHDPAGQQWGKAVTYGFTTESAALPVGRLAYIDYPAEGEYRRRVSYTRNTGDNDYQKIDWITGRISKLSDYREDDGLAAGEVAYTYIGAARAVQVDYGESENQGSLKYLSQLSPSETPGFDRFGRVKFMKSTDADDNTMVGYEYAYDRLHNPVSRDDLNTTLRDEEFAYDDLGRLGSFDPEGANNTRAWQLTALGNWRRVTDNGTPTDSRKHNAQNEITEHKVGAGQSTVMPDSGSYDLEGNLIEVPYDNADQETEFLTFVYDAWNRLVKVVNTAPDPDETIAEYERDGLGRIIVNATTNEHYYYSLQWQLLARFDDDLQYDGLVKEYLWGPRYIDELVATVTYGGTTTRRYHVQDANWNVIATYDDDAQELEAIIYDPYGKAAFYERIAGISWWGAGNFTSPCGTDFLFQGRWYETFNVGGNKLRLYHFRHRVYGPKLGRFLQRDPLGVWAMPSSGGNGYAAMANRPTNSLDPIGLRTVIPPRTKEGHRSCPWQKLDPIESRCEWCEGNEDTYGDAVKNDSEDCCCSCKRRRISFFDADSFPGEGKKLEQMGAGFAFGVTSVWHMLRTLQANINECECVEKLTITMHGGDFSRGGAFAFAQSPHEWDAIDFNADAFGDKIAGIMCKDKCVINIMTCNSSPGEGMLIAAYVIAARTGCRVRAVDGHSSIRTSRRNTPLGEEVEYSWWAENGVFEYAPGGKGTRQRIHGPDSSGTTVW